MKRIVTIIVLLVGIWFVHSRLAGTPPETISGVTYEEKLAELSAGSIATIEQGSAEEKAAIDRFTSLWANFNAAYVDRELASVYDRNVWFNDTVKTITNREDLLHYMIETVNRVQACAVRVQDIARSGDNFYIRWKMEIDPSASTDERWESVGVSHIRFNQQGLVVLHQDYWDSASGLYEHLPVIGWIIRAIKSRL
jgi:Uncharacterized conserved protein (DUF2358)